MKLERSRTKDQIFAEMHRELRSWNPEVPESPERLDPILKMLLELYANQLAGIEERIDRVWEVATGSLIRSLLPECKRWPVPAFTIIQCSLTDPVVEVDPDTRLIYREKREGGSTFFFSPHRSEKLLAAEFKHILLRCGDKLTSMKRASDGDHKSAHPMSERASQEQASQIFLGIDFEGTPSEFEKSLLYMTGQQQALRQIRWSRWLPADTSGEFSESQSFCPGLESSIDDAFDSDSESPADWGGMRSSKDLFGDLEDNFVLIPSGFAHVLSKGPVNRELGDLAFQSGVDLQADGKQLYWIRLDLPEGGDRTALGSKIDIRSDCFIATNKNELTLFKHTGGSRLVEVELPEDISSILDISGVVDSDDTKYRPAYEAQTDPMQSVYSVEERDDKFVLWFDFTSTMEPPPESITVTYSTNGGIDANGIEVGKIDELYENHPGIKTCTNIRPTSGAIPAKTSEQVVMEATARLRNRDRALSFQEISRWALTFDRRILDAHCENSTERTVRGVRRCIALKTRLNSDEFHSPEEIELTRSRLEKFLKSRSPVNTQFKVEITE